MVKALKPSQVILEPYPHVAIPNFTGLGEALDENFPPLGLFGKTVRMDGDLFSEDAALVSYLNENDTYRGLLNHLKSVAFVSNLIASFQEQIAKELAKGELLLDPRDLEIVEEPLETRGGEPINETSYPRLFCRIDLGFGGEGYGLKNGGKGIHTDNRRRLLSCLLYINTPEEMAGGEHRMYSVDAAFSPRISKSYPPKEDFFVGSLQSNFAFHDVNPITKISGVRKAIYVGVTCTTDIWKRIPSSRQARLAKNRPYPGFLLRTAHKAKRLVPSS